MSSSTPQSPELQQESPVVQESTAQESPVICVKTADGLHNITHGGDSIRTALQNLPPQLKVEFLTQFKLLKELAVELENEAKAAKAALREIAKAEKEQSEKEKCHTVVTNILEKHGGTVHRPDGCETASPTADDIISACSLAQIKEWIKEVKADLKANKEAIKQAKLDEKQAKEDAKQAKLDEKQTKLDAQREKLLTQLPALIELIDYEPEYNEETITLAELKLLHSRVKMLGQLRKYAMNVNDIPDYEDDEIPIDELKELHTRCKLINIYNRCLDVESISYTDGADKDLSALKEMVQDAK